MIDWAPIIEKGVSALAPKLFEAAIDAASKGFQKLQPYAALSFDEHFTKAYERCTKIKTMVTGDAPVDLLTNYVNLNFKNRDKIIDDYGVIDAIWSKRKVVISGPAGCGKSMFMRYLWIACFIQSRGKIPLFLELRQLNSIESTDLLSFIYYSCLRNPPKEGRSLFDKAIKEGQFFFIFDGFDELTPAKLEPIEREILNLSTDGQNVVVVSGRPDDRFAAWHSFNTYKVEPLTKKQVLSLLKVIDFDKIIKSKFIAQVKNDLYEKHKDIISRPLLATMMLLTFNSFAEIPNRIHVFYDQAFDTLFSRHDATKEAFKRKRYTDFPIDEFKRIFGLFCLITYVEQKSELSESEILEYIGKAGRIARVNITPVAFLDDLLKSVCVVQREGINIVFSHRSFQEYFCAYAIVRLTQEEAVPLTYRISNRRQDSVIPMLFEMNRSFLEDVYVSKMREKCGPFLASASDMLNIKEIVAFFECTIVAQFMFELRGKGPPRHGQVYISTVASNRSYDFIHWVHTLYDIEPTDLGIAVIESDDVIEGLLALGGLRAQKRRAAALMIDGIVGLKRVEIDTDGTENRVIEVHLDEVDRFFEWLQETAFTKNFVLFLIRGNELLDRIGIEREEKRDEVLSLLLPGDAE